MERLFVLKILSRTQQAPEVKIKCREGLCMLLLLHAIPHGFSAYIHKLNLLKSAEIFIKSLGVKHQYYKNHKVLCYYIAMISLTFRLMVADFCSLVLISLFIIHCWER